MMLSLIALCFATVYFFFIFILRLGLSRLNPCIESKLFRTSIIVAMKNEMRNVRLCMEALSHQDYPKDRLEIVIVDDGSTDGTSEILAEYQEKFPHIKILRNDSTPIGVSSKKLALSKAIAKGTGEILLFTDADCVPPPYWVHSMIACFEPGVGFVVGFSPLIDPTDSVFGKLLLLDSVASGIVAAGCIGLKGAATCTGRNLAYRREIFDQVNGFDKIMYSVSGDDDLFVQLVRKETNWKIKFSTDNESIVPSYQTINFKEFFTQKRRHLSAGKYYNFKLQIAYFLFHSANLFIFTFFLLSTIWRQYFLLALLLLLAKFLFDRLLFVTASKIFNVHLDKKYFVLWVFFFVAYHIIISPLSWIGKIKWK
jgi:cellulose synthase/poly-beta-1,6-N-acetylglucosamine synthase-like glycosyltransferase